jgi:hypothetical protein
MLFFARNTRHSKNLKCYNATVREYALFLRLLAEEVYTARLEGGQRLLDAMDFKEWLLEASEKAGEAHSLDEFFSRLRRL